MSSESRVGQQEALDWVCCPPGGVCPGGSAVIVPRMD